MKKKCDLLDFYHGMIVGTRRAGFSQSFIKYWSQQIKEFMLNGVKNCWSIMVGENGWICLSCEEASPAI